MGQLFRSRFKILLFGCFSIQFICDGATKNLNETTSSMFNYQRTSINPGTIRMMSTSSNDKDSKEYTNKYNEKQKLYDELFDQKLEKYPYNVEHPFNEFHPGSPPNFEPPYAERSYKPKKFFSDYILKPAKQLFSARSSSMPSMPSSYPLPAPSNHIPFHDSDNKYLAEATDHGHGWGHGKGHGEGWGWGGGGGNGWGWGGGHTSHTYHHVSKGISNNSLGLLGLLGLLSLISQVLLLLTTTAAAAAADGGGRNKRSLELTPWQTKKKNLYLQLLPALNIVGHTKDRKLPFQCAHHAVCRVNAILYNELSNDGRHITSIISSAITRLLEGEERQYQSDWRNNSLRRKSNSSFHPHKHNYMYFPLKSLQMAGLDGQNGKNCDLIYPKCQVQRIPDLITEKHVLAYV